MIVGEPTERATRHVIEYEALPATRVKGKAEALHAHVATSVRTDTPEREEDDPPPFVGRIRERELLHDLLGRTIGDRTPRLVTVVGEPGIGKTRLVQDLHEHLRATHDGTSWHRGRCRPYGESITYAALDEVVRSIAGIAPGSRRGGGTDAPRCAPGRARPERRRPRLDGGASAPARRAAGRRRHAGRRRRDVHGVDPLPRGVRRAQPAHRRRRRPALGRRGAARVPGTADGTRPRRAALPAVHGSPGAVRAPAGVGGRGRPRDDHLAVAAHRRRDGGAARRAAGAVGHVDVRRRGAPSPRRREPAVRAGVRAHARGPGRGCGARRGRAAGRRRRVGARHRAGPDRRPARCARGRRPRGAAGRRGHRRSILAGRPRGARARRARPRRHAAHAAAAWAGPAFVDQRDRRRGRVLVRARAHPRRRLRASAQSRPVAAASRRDRVARDGRRHEHDGAGRSARVARHQGARPGARGRPRRRHRRRWKPSTLRYLVVGRRSPAVARRGESGDATTARRSRSLPRGPSAPRSGAPPRASAGAREA